jgi:hypothetical protein
MGLIMKKGAQRTLEMLRKEHEELEQVMGRIRMINNDQDMVYDAFSPAAFIEMEQLLKKHDYKDFPYLQEYSIMVPSSSGYIRYDN